MAQFDKNNFKNIISEIEQMETKKENIWVPIGILEYMYNDFKGYIDNYFSIESNRDVDQLWDNLWKQSNSYP